MHNAWKAELADQKVRLIAIVKEDLPGELEEFRNFMPEAEILVDETMGMYKVGNNGEPNKVSHGVICKWICGLLVNSKRRKSVTAATSEFGNNTKGEGQILGSALVVDSSGTIRYCRTEQHLDDHPEDFSELVGTVKDLTKTST